MGGLPKVQSADPSCFTEVEEPSFPEFPTQGAQWHAPDSWPLSVPLLSFSDVLLPLEAALCTGA